MATTKGPQTVSQRLLQNFLNTTSRHHQDYIMTDSRALQNGYYQAQLKLASSVPVKLGTETGLIITVRPTPRGRTSILQVPRKLKFGMQANFKNIK